MNVVAILQARAGSSRLPLKVLQPILGRPMLAHQLDRVRRARSLDALIVATSTDPDDDAIERLCAGERVACFRGSLHDVLDRFYQSARLHHPGSIVRLTGDCPLIDPALIDRVVDFFRTGRFDLVATAETYPDGLDVEVLRFETLTEAWRDADAPSDREHVTLFVRRQPDRFRVGLFPSEIDLSHLRLTVDEPQDFELVKRIYEALYPENAAFTTEDVLQLLRARPELLTLNRGIRRNEGLERSLATDPGDSIS
jgi:spore coat polysaccharide biosynthesis protein SpsF (cytidylyltransferase family)